MRFGVCHLHPLFSSSGAANDVAFKDKGMTWYSVPVSRSPPTMFGLLVNILLSGWKMTSAALKLNQFSTNRQKRSAASTQT